MARHFESFTNFESHKKNDMFTGHKTYLHKLNDLSNKVVLGLRDADAS